MFVLRFHVLLLLLFVAAAVLRVCVKCGFVVVGRAVSGAVAAGVALPLLSCLAVGMGVVMWLPLSSCVVVLVLLSLLLLLSVVGVDCCSRWLLLLLLVLLLLFLFVGCCFW